jgi:glutamyl-tRNA synthetase
MVNFLGMMAFTFEDGREIFSLQDFVEHFKLERVSLGGPVFDLKKLLWLNGRYLREKRTDDDIVAYLKQQLFTDDYLKRIVAIAKERFEKSEDFIDYAPYFFTGTVPVDVAELVVKGKTPKESAELFEALVEKIDVLFDWKADKIEALVRAFGEEKGVPKELFMPLRLMVTGKKATPPLFDVLAILGRERVRTRMRAILDPLKKLPPPADKPPAPAKT